MLGGITNRAPENTFHKCDSFINTLKVNRMNHQINKYFTALRPLYLEKLEDKGEGGGTGT